MSTHITDLIVFIVTSDAVRAFFPIRSRNLLGSVLPSRRYAQNVDQIGFIDPVSAPGNLIRRWIEFFAILVEILQIN